VIILLLTGSKLLMGLGILGLMFIEWNMLNAFFEMRFLSAAIYTDVLFAIMLIIMDNINIKSLTLYTLLQMIVLNILSILNYILLYGNKLIIAAVKRDNIKSSFFKDIYTDFINDEKTTTRKGNRNILHSNVIHAFKSEEDSYMNNSFTGSCTNQSFTRNINHIRSFSNNQIYSKRSNSNIYINSKFNQSILNNSTSNHNSNNNINTPSRRVSIISKIVNYHYTTSLSENDLANKNSGIENNKNDIA